MNALDLLFITSIATVIFAFLISRSVLGRMLLTMAYGLQLVILLQIDPSAKTVSDFSVSVFSSDINWQMDGLGWFFALITIAIAGLTSWYSSSSFGQYQQAANQPIKLFHVGLALNVFAMLVLLSSADFLALFIGWELVSWAGVLLMLLGGKESRKSTARYVTYAIAGGMSVFAGLVLLYAWSDASFEFLDMADSIQQLSTAQLMSVSLLLVGGFSVKMGLMPFHLWQAPAYAMTSGPATIFLSAISSRMGLFAIVLVVFKIITLESLVGIQFFSDAFSLRDLFAWIAAITIVLPTYTALRQNDARLLLTWHGIGQGGYMMLGLLVLDGMGTAGGLMHVFNYATYQAAIFMAIYAVIYRTGTPDLNRLGGLVTRMPLSFLVLLLGIIGLAGLPPMNGFVSKWMIYRSLVEEGMALLFIASVIGTLGTILSVYKLIHNSFLGQLRVEHQHVSEAPWSMMIPMLILSLIAFITGFMPGLVLEYIVYAQQAMGMDVVHYTLGGVQAVNSKISGDLDMIWIVVVLFSGFGIAAILFLSAGKSKRIHQLDNYAGGHFLTAENQYQYSDNFYAGLMHLIKPWYRGTFTWLESALISVTDTLAGLFKSFFNQPQPLVWLLGGSVAVMAWLTIGYLG